MCSKRDFQYSLITHALLIKVSIKSPLFTTTNIKKGKFWAGQGGSSETVISSAWVIKQSTLCLGSLNELVGQVLRSQQSEMGLLEQFVWKRRIRFIFSSIIMYKSPTTFLKGCTKVKSHKWICDVKRVRHIGRKKEKKEAKGMGHSAKGELKKRNWLKQSQDKLTCIYCDLIWRVWKGEKKEKMKK